MCREDCATPSPLRANTAQKGCSSRNRPSGRLDESCKNQCCSVRERSTAQRAHCKSPARIRIEEWPQRGLRSGEWLGGGSNRLHQTRVEREPVEIFLSPKFCRRRELGLQTKLVASARCTRPQASSGQLLRLPVCRSEAALASRRNMCQAGLHVFFY